jgi:hypothetical protein
VDKIKLKASLAVAALFAMTAVGCSQDNNSAEGPSAKDPVGNIQFDWGVKKAERNAIADSINVIDDVQISNPDSKMLSIMGLGDASSYSLRNWLEARVQYILPQNFDLQKNFLVQEGYSYPSSVQKKIKAKKVNDTAKAEVLMSNVGSVLYLYGKENDALVGLKLQGFGAVAVTSPRVGIIQVGPGFFSGKVDSNKVIARNIYRAGTLFHEARHSDGHGSSLAFSHAICPSGHDYEGLAACDRNANGPYTVGALIIKNLAKSCTVCSTAHLQILQTIYLDNISRVIVSEQSRSSYWDDAPEGKR